MIKVDRKKHREFEEEYAEIAINAIAHMRPTVKKGSKNIRLEPEGGWDALTQQYLNKNYKNDLKLGFKNLLMLYQKIENYDMCEVMELNRLMPPIEEGDLKIFVKRFLLAEPRIIRKANKYLKDYIKNLPKGKKDFSTDAFLKYFQSHAYESMCSRRDENGVKLNVKIAQSLEIRVCPYCGCAYIGGRGDEFLGAQLDHFVSRSNYPFFALCLYNLIPSCGSCNLRKSIHDSYELMSPFDENAAFDANIGIRLHSRPYVRITSEGKYQESHMEVKVTASKDDEEYERYSANIKEFNLLDVYDYFEKDAEEYVEKMIRYPKSQMRELEDILAVDQEGIEGWSSRVKYRRQLERDLFLEHYAEDDKQARVLNSKMYTDLYRTYRKLKKETEEIL